METVFMQKYIDILVIENRIGLSSVQKGAFIKVIINWLTKTLI